MLVMLVATVMLAAGLLVYFAFAADVEPYGPVAKCSECNAPAYEQVVARTGPYTGTHKPDGVHFCQYTFYIVVEDYVCKNGHHESARVYQEQYDHDCWDW